MLLLLLEGLTKFTLTLADDDGKEEVGRDVMWSGLMEESGESHSDSVLSD